MHNLLSGSRARLARRVLALFFCAGILGACGSDPDQLVASARKYIDANDPKAAVIQLKNALQERPDHAEARFLLGQLNSQAGDYAAAATEFERARKAGYAEDRVVPPLARAMLTTGDAKKVVEGFASVKLSDPAASGVLSSVLGDAYLAQGDVAAAKQAYEGALAAMPGDERARIGLARIQAGEKDLDGAKRALAGVLADHPASSDAHALLAAIAIAEGNADEAVAEYRRAVESDPKQVMNHFRLISLLLRDGAIEPARAAFADMKKAVGGTQLYSIYLQAYLDFLDRKDDAAAEGVAKVIRSAPDFIPARLLAGTIHLRKRDVNQTLQHLGVVLSAQPDNVVARRLIASAHLLGGNPDKAIENLGPLLRKFPKDAAVLSLVGQAYLAKGDFTQSSEYFAKALLQNPQDAQARVRLGVSRLGAGDAEQGFADLEKASMQDESGIPADVALSMARLRQGKFDQALEAVARIEKKQPDNPLGPNLRGGALLAKGDLVGARAAFDKALSLNATYLPAIVNLARLDLNDKHPDAARRRLADLVKANPADANAHLALADILAKSDATKAEIRAALENGIKAVPDSLPMKIALARFLSDQGEHKEALALVQQAQTSAPDDANLLSLLGAAQLGAGQAEQAVSSYRRLVGLQPESAQALMLLARAEVAAGNPDAAEQSLSKAYKLQPELPDAYRSLVGLRLQQKNFSAAREIALEVQKRLPAQPDGHLLAADVALKQSDWAGAVASLRSAQKIEASPQTVIVLHAALQASGDSAAATREVEAWLAKSPKDLVVRGYLAELDLRKRDYNGALGRYRKMIELAPDNALLLNNLAWTAAQAKDAKALEYAQKAHRLAPDNAAILDTLGMIKLEAGDVAGGLKDVQRASELAPKTIPISLNLARAYARSGDAKKASQILDGLQSQEQATPALKDEIAKIRASL